MNTQPHIVAATDLSALARHAADRAARVARETGATLALVHVLPEGALESLTHWLGAGHVAASRVQHDARQRLEALAAELARPAHAVPVQTVCAVGNVLAQIDRAAETLRATLVVLGARGEGFLRHRVLGTTAERLLRRTACPVLMVRQTPHERYRRVLLAVDFSPWSSQSLAAARQVAPHASLVLCHAWQVPFEEKLHFAGVDSATIAHYRQKARDDATHRLHALADAAGLKRGSWEPCIVEGDASTSLVEAEQSRDCDLVVLGKHGRSAGEELLLGSVTRHMLEEGASDVLVSTRRDG